jgi:phosphotransferase system HPr-like phosphotransfer protein
MLKEENEMTTFKLSINTVEKAKNLCTIAGEVNADIDLVSGRYVVDAKSLLGIFSLDLSKTLVCELHTDDIEMINKFKSGIAEFIVD